MEDFAISLKNISKIYPLYPDKQSRLKEALNPFGKKYHREFKALQNINLDIPKGSIVGILGKNGAGKSTLLKIISSSPFFKFLTQLQPQLLFRLFRKRL